MLITIKYRTTKDKLDVNNQVEFEAACKSIQEKFPNVIEITKASFKTIAWLNLVMEVHWDIAQFSFTDGHFQVLISNISRFLLNRYEGQVEDEFCRLALTQPPNVFVNIKNVTLCGGDKFKSLKNIQQLINCEKLIIKRYEYIENGVLDLLKIKRLVKVSCFATSDLSHFDLCYLPPICDGLRKEEEGQDAWGSIINDQLLSNEINIGKCQIEMFKSGLKKYARC